MRILLVGNYALDKQSSMLRYADMLCRQMTERGHEVEVIQPGPVVGDLARRGILRKWLGYVDKYILFPAKLRARSRGFDLVHICDHSNSVYLPHTGGRPSSITCHDVLAIASARGQYSEQNISSTGRAQQRWILKHLAAARNVVCVSANTARELAALSPPLKDGAARNICVIPNALNFDYTRAPDEVVLALRQRLGLAEGERYLMHIGGDQWYKNRMGVLRIFERLSRTLGDAGRPPLRLVMAGSPWPETMRSFVAGHRLEGQVVELADPSNADLCALYSGATALLFPSLYEGFGWPVVEAQSCGCPVIASNRKPMTEVAGDAALYIDPADEAGAAALIAASLDGLAGLREAGLRNVERFSSDRIVPAYERFFLQVAASATPPAIVRVAD